MHNSQKVNKKLNQGEIKDQSVAKESQVDYPVVIVETSHDKSESKKKEAMMRMKQIL